MPEGPGIEPGDVGRSVLHFKGLIAPTKSLKQSQDYLVKCFAVLPLCVHILPDPQVGAVHEGDEDVDEEDDGDALVHGPHGETSHVGELQGEIFGLCFVGISMSWIKLYFCI